MPRAAIVGIIAACCAACGPVGCDEPGVVPSRSDFATATETLPVRFEELYPVFLWHASMPQGEKSRLWNRYHGRWVRWEGVIASITDKGATLRHLRATVTFDVSLTCETGVVATLKRRFATGDRVRYVGMLESYDDVFRTMYLTHGVVIEKVPHGDLGVPADLSYPSP